MLLRRELENTHVNQKQKLFYIVEPKGSSASHATENATGYVEGKTNNLCL